MTAVLRKVSERPRNVINRGDRLSGPMQSGDTLVRRDIGMPGLLDYFIGKRRRRFTAVPVPARRRRRKPVADNLLVKGHLATAGLSDGSRLPEPIFDPDTKAPPGQHDENLTAAELAVLVGADTAAELARTWMNPE